MPNALERLTARVHQLESEVVPVFRGGLLTPSRFGLYCESFGAVMPDLSLAALQDTLRDQVGRTVSEEDVRLHAWRVAGNYDSICDGVAAYPFAGTFESNERIVFQIADMGWRRRGRRPRDESEKATAGQGGMIWRNGWSVRLFAMTGSAAGVTLRAFWSDDLIRSWRQEFGFHRWNNLMKRVQPLRTQRPLLDSREIYRMRIRGTVDMEKSKSPSVVFAAVDAYEPVTKWNRAIMDLRRRETYRCPLNYDPAEVDCFRCHAGLDTCRAACHSRGYVTQPCVHCQRDNALADPKDPEGRCLRCVSQLEAI